MKHTIEDLWNGNLAPADQCGAHDPKVNICSVGWSRTENPCANP